MSKISFYIFLLFIISACNSEPTFQPPELDHYQLDAVLDHMPFDKFNEFSKAIFRDIEGLEFTFKLSINEDIVESFAGNDIYTSNQITFRYGVDFDFEIPTLEVIARVEYLPELEFTEMLVCKTIIPISSFSGEKLNIIPGQNYQNTVLNENFSWMGEKFENVYANVLIEENPVDNIKVFYQSSIGIIGFNDNIGKAWIFDRFE